MIGILPHPVFESVANHLRQCGRLAHRDWDVAEANEDSLTGAAFARFWTRNTRRLYVDGVVWRWRISARKFHSGRGRSEEVITGADGIVEVEVSHVATGQKDTKGLLVQAKKRWQGRVAKLEDQVRKMEELAPGCSAVFDYSPDGYRGMEGRKVLEAEANRRELSVAEDLGLGDFLVDRFLACECGLRGLYYEARRRQLHLPSVPGRPNAVLDFIPQRMRIEIEDREGA